MNAAKLMGMRIGIMGDRNWAFWPLVILTVIVSLFWVERLYWTYWPFEPLVVRGITVKNVNGTVCAGGRLLYSLDVTRATDAPVKIKRQLVNSFQLDFPAIEPPSKLLGDQNVLAYLDIPSFTEEGLHFMRWEAEFALNQYRTVTVKAETKPFTVVKCK